MSVSCVAVTRGGLGDLWLFDSLEEADEHPIVQYGDAICTSGRAVQETFRPAELAPLAERLGDRRLASEIEALVGQRRHPVLQDVCGRLFQLMEQSASRPPGPTAVMRIVAEDRRWTRERGVSMRKDPTVDKTGATATTTAKAPKEKRVSNLPSRAKFQGTSVISFGKDKDGKPYGADNNPKRDGSAAHKRFALYKSGMTIEQAKAAGITAGDINWDQKQGFISIS